MTRLELKMVGVNVRSIQPRLYGQGRGLTSKDGNRLPGAPGKVGHERWRQRQRVGPRCSLRRAVVCICYVLHAAGRFNTQYSSVVDTSWVRAHTDNVPALHLGLQRLGAAAAEVHMHVSAVRTARICTSQTWTIESRRILHMHDNIKACRLTNQAYMYLVSVAC